MVVKETIENIVQSKVGNKMNIEQINILDKLLLEARKSVNSNYLHLSQAIKGKNCGRIHSALFSAVTQS